MYSVVHDPAGDDWTNERPFYEGEKGSENVTHDFERFPIDCVDGISKWQ